MLEIYAAGAAAAFTVDLLVYPLDTLKTRIQSQDFKGAYAAAANAPGAALKARNQTLFRGLYQGVGSVILATLPAAGVFFSVYEYAKGALSENNRLPTPVVHATASAVAEIASCLILAPAEVVKQNAQMIHQQDRGSRSATAQAFRHIVSPGSQRRLWSGYTALVARNLPFTACQFPVFEFVRGQWWSRHAQGDVTPGLLETGVITGFSAGLAGSFAALITTPSDVVKTRMMLSAGATGGGQDRAGGGSASTQPRVAFLAVARQVYAEKGWRGLFRGGLLRATWTALGSGLYLGTYETSKVWLTRRGEGRDRRIVDL